MSLQSLLSCTRAPDAPYWYYPIWLRSSPRKRATSSITASSKALASTANPASSTRPTPAPQKRSPHWSKTAPHRPRFLLPHGTSDCPAHSGAVTPRATGCAAARLDRDPVQAGGHLQGGDLLRLRRVVAQRDAALDLQPLPRRRHPRFQVVAREGEGLAVQGVGKV